MRCRTRKRKQGASCRKRKRKERAMWAKGEEIIDDVGRRGGGVHIGQYVPGGEENNG